MVFVTRRSMVAIVVNRLIQARNGQGGRPLGEVTEGPLGPDMIEASTNPSSCNGCNVRLGPRRVLNRAADGTGTSIPLVDQLIDRIDPSVDQWQRRAAGAGKSPAALVLCPSMGAAGRPKI